MENEVLVETSGTPDSFELFSNPSWLLGDHLGSTSMVADASGVMVSEVRYSAFGETRYQNGTLTTDYLYTGQRQEAEIGLYYYVARWYDPAIGRFIQADSIVPNPASALGFDRYAYANNSPLKYSDPNGHTPIVDDCDFFGNCADTGGMSTSIYWRGFSEAELAKYQQNQGSSMNCGKFAFATGLSALYDQKFSGSQIMSWINNTPILGVWERYSVFGDSDNGSFMYHIENLANDVSIATGLGFTADRQPHSTEVLRNMLRNDNSLALVSIAYFKNQKPVVSRGDEVQDRLGSSDGIIGGHIMLAVAYDPSHIDTSGNVNPWGFLSSWQDGGTEIYWMSDQDFKNSFWSMVIISKGN